MRILKAGSSDFQETFDSLILRRQTLMDELSSEVDSFFAKYRSRREEALVEWAKEFDHVELDEAGLWVDEDFIKSAHKLVSKDIRKAIDHAKDRIERFQSELKLPSFQSNEESGVFWGTEVRPLDRVGVYVPGGRANYFMTLLLCAVPAKIAGVKDILLASPPRKKLGKPFIEPTLLYLAKTFSISKILLAGGVGAMAAMAFGTKKTLPVEKIFGSGGKRAAVAKLKLSGYIGVEGLSGPSETAFVCDKTTSVKQIAADIIGKADHDPDAEIFVFHSDAKWMEELVQRLAQSVETSKNHLERSSIQACLEKRTTLFIVKSLDDAIEKVNQLTPGVVCLAVDDASKYIPEVKSCGSLLLGHYTPPVGLDLVGGASGLVSTLGSAAFSVSMSPASFVRRFTVMEFDKPALERLQKESISLAKEEGFLTHEAALQSRFED
ncbi:MAG: Histidinol dehydrogenase [Bacteriovoracaceae bacterium]|nr:Histidinol dehydrogenase [Bacteriovoracaceae bacterium]